MSLFRKRFPVLFSDQALRTRRGVLPCAAAWALVAVVLSPLSAQNADAQNDDAAKARTPTSTLPVGVLGRVDGQEITVEDYSRFLYVYFAQSKLHDLISRILTEREAARLGVSISAEDVENEVKERLESTRVGIYRGEQERMEEDLRRRGMTLEDYKARLQQAAAYELLRDACLLATRTVTDAEVRRRFAEVYGEDGVRHELRHLMIAAPSDQKDAQAVETARGKAAEILKELRAGVDFVEMVRKHSEDPFSQKNDGRIPAYRAGSFGDDFHRAVIGLDDKNRISRVVRSNRGFHIVYLVRKLVTSFDEKRSEVKEELEKRRPTAGDRDAFLKTLRGRAKIETRLR